MSLFIYLKYKLREVVDTFSPSGMSYSVRDFLKEAGKLKTYISVYAGIFLFLVFERSVMGAPIPLWVIVLNFFSLIAIWVVYDYRKGDHTRWDRERKHGDVHQA